MIYDVLIVGAGVIGGFIARELSKYSIKACIVEKEGDVCLGTSKANSAIIHAGYDPRTESLKAKLNVRGNEIMEGICKELDVPFRRIGSLVLAFNEEDRQKLVELMERGINNGVKDLSIITREQMNKMARGVSQEAKYALYAPSTGIVCPYELTIGAVENAVENGIEIKLGHKVEGIHTDEAGFSVVTDKGELKCRYIVNAAGLYSDDISALIGDDSFTIMPKKGEYILFEKSQGEVIDKVIFQIPTSKGKGILVTPTVDGNLLIGPNAKGTNDKGDNSTSACGLEQVINAARISVPAINMREAITSFSGLRASSTADDFIIKASSLNEKFINVAGIDSPGLTAAPAIAEYVTGILVKQGLSLIEKKGFNPSRKPIVRFRTSSEEEMNEIIKAEPLYGRIVCRCERVTEGEIVDCIRRSVGARNLDGVKGRTRAAMGRCQGGFCTPRVIEILARELKIPMEEITKSGGKSYLLTGKTK